MKKKNEQTPESEISVNANVYDRRHFIKSLAVAGAAISVLPAAGFAANNSSKPTFRVGAVGVGGRGRGAMNNIRAAAEVAGVDVKFVAVADPQESAVEQAGNQFDVPSEYRFVGFDAYRKVMDAGVDVVILAAPPAFRPVHFEAAVEAGCHSFIEKPVAVDPQGARRMYAAGEEARRKGLSVVAGTQRRHTNGYLAQRDAVRDGAIGDIVGGKVMWCQNRLWVRNRHEGESNKMYLARNWVNFLEVGGDHIVEQHLHNIDIANWFIGRTPRMALGFGGRARRQSGNLYDFFSVDFDYGDNCSIHSMCRQMNNTYTRTGEWLTGTEGALVGGSRVSRFDGRSVNLPEYDLHPNGLVQEHVHLLQSIVNEEGRNETRDVTDSTVTAMMGCLSAYSGSIVRFIDLTEREDSEWYDWKVNPAAEDFEKDEDVYMPEEEVAPVPGSA